MEKLKANQADVEEEEEEVETEEEAEKQARAGTAHVEPEGNRRPPMNANVNGNPFKRPMNTLQKQWYRVLLARRVGFGQRVPQDEKEVT